MINRLQKKLDEKKAAREHYDEQLASLEQQKTDWLKDIEVLDVEIELLTNYIQKMKESET